MKMGEKEKSAVKDKQNKVFPVKKKPLQKTHQASKHKEEQYKTVFNSCPYGILITTFDQKIIDANESLLKMLGNYTLVELKKISFQGLTPKKWHRKDKNSLKVIMKNGHGTFSKEFIRKDGTFVSVSLACSIINDKKGDRVNVCIFVEEITGRNQSEPQLQKTVDFLNNIIDSSLDSILGTDDLGNIVRANKSLLNLTGFTEEEILGKHTAELSPYEEGTYECTTGQSVDIGEDFFADGTNMSNILFEKGKISNWERYFLRKDNKIVPVEVNTVMLYENSGEFIGAAGIVRDITERRKKELEVKQTKNILESIFASSVDGILGNDSEGFITMANDAVVEMSGYSRGELLGKHSKMLVPKDLKYKERGRLLIETLFEKGAVSGFEYVWKRKDGRLIDVELCMALTKDAEGNIKGGVTTLREITERKKAEQERVQLEKQLKRAEKRETVGALAGGVAHDLNNILSGIVSYPDLLLMKLPDDSALKKPIATIKQSGERAAAIVQDLLTLARRGTTVSEVVNLNSIVSQYIKSPEHERLLEFHPGTTLEINLGKDVLNILGTPVHLSKMIMNLVSNAAEAMPKGGSITLSTQNTYINSVENGFAVLKEADYVVFTVADTGIGISKKDQDKIFEPFYTKKELGRSGSGLGMAVVWGTVEDHHGYIDVKSSKGKGTTFTIYFPATRKKLQGDEQVPVSVDEYRGKGEKILVVDDLVTQRDIASEILSELGYAVDTVSSGEDAIEYMKTHTADLLMLDMIMLPGMNGLETYEKILEHHPDQKAIIASGFSETGLVKKAQGLGVGAFIRKPYTLEKIGLAIKAELGKTL